MALEYRIKETGVQAAWLRTFYDLVEELNCKCQVSLEETYNRSFRHFERITILEVYGSETMLSWFKLRMERYSHFISSFNEKPELTES